MRRRKRGTEGTGGGQGRRGEFEWVRCDRKEGGKKENADLLVGEDRLHDLQEELAADLGDQGDVGGEVRLVLVPVEEDGATSDGSRQLDLAVQLARLLDHAVGLQEGQHGDGVAQGQLLMLSEEEVLRHAQSAQEAGQAKVLTGSWGGM